MKVYSSGLRYARVVLLWTCASAFPACAQSGGVHADPAQDGDIVVTALRRDTTLQKTPISISAISGDSLVLSGASSMNDYFRQTPNVQIEGGGPATRRISIRGVRSAGEATVGLYYDETPLTGPGGTSADAGITNPDVNLFDVERVEVLRGPQGTLFGAGSMGGTLRMIFKRPDAQEFGATFEGQVTATKGGDPGYLARAMVNAPLLRDKIAVRAVAYRETRGGYIDLPQQGRDNVNDTRSYGGRLLVGITPTDGVSLNLSAHYQNNKLDGPASYTKALGPYDFKTRAVSMSGDELQIYNANFSADLPWNAKLTASISHYAWDVLRTADYSALMTNLRASASACRRYIGVAACDADQLADYGAYVDSRLPGLLHQPMTLRNWVYEARISGSFANGLLDYTGGAYHEDRKDHIDSQVVRTDATGVLIEPLDITSWREVATSVKQSAAFGEFALKPVQGLTLTAGVRRFSYAKVVTGQVLVNDYITQSYVGPRTRVDANSSGWVKKLAASYEISPDVMSYVSASDGFRPGGANNIPGLTAGLVTYQPDRLWNYELGLKTRWFDRKLTVNAAVFQIDWSNMQVSGRSAVAAFNFLTNAGQARLRGAELEVAAEPVAGLNLGAAFGFVDAKLTEDQLNSDLAATGSTGFKGDRIPNIPRLTANLNAEYHWAMSNTVRATVRLDFTHTSSSHTEFRPTYVYYDRNSSYQNVDARFGVTIDEMIDVQAFVRNVLNEDRPLQVQSTALGMGQATTLPPRTVGVLVRARM